MVKAFTLKKRVAIFKSIKEMTLYHYGRYLDTSDLKYFSNYYELKNPKQPSDEELSESLSLIFEQMLEMTENYEIIERISNTHKLHKLTIKYKCVQRLIECIRMHDIRLGMNLLTELIEQLDKWSYRIDSDKDLFKQIDKIEKRIQGIKSEIESLTIKIKKDNQDEKTDLEESIFNVGQGLEMKYKIEPKETSLFTWLLMQKRLKEKIRLMEKRNRK